MKCPDTGRFGNHVLAETALIKFEERLTFRKIEFSDFQCQFCERFYTQTLPSIKAEYIGTGKAKL